MTEPCPGRHRLPEGPNEDIAICRRCGYPTYALRPDGETYGDHLPDCSRERRHVSWCAPGGAGHPAAAIIRGYWPLQWLVRYEIHDTAQPLTSDPVASGALTIASETAEHAVLLARLKVSKDHALDLVDDASLVIGEPVLVPTPEE